MLFNEQSFIFIFLPVVLGRLRIGSQADLRLGSREFFFLLRLFMHGNISPCSGSVIDFWLGSRIQKSEKPKTKFNLMSLGIFGNLGVLAVFFKYSDFFLLQLGYDEGFGLLLPLAIFFFYFSANRLGLGERKTYKPWFLALLCVRFIFPQLIAGPIVRCQKIIPQLKRRCWGSFRAILDWVVPLFHRSFQEGLSCRWNSSPC